jgi:uncharacterized membrane protein HdeD (DUF308 family)
MSTVSERPSVVELRHVLVALRGHWMLFVLLGCVLVVLGAVALASPWVATLATAVVLGWLLIAGGVTEAVGAFWSRGWSGFIVPVLSGLLSILVGLLFVLAPADAALAVTLSLSCLLLLAGVAKMAAVLNCRFAAWGWSLLNGATDAILGMLILLWWPMSGFWLIGVFVGISLLFRGFNWIALGVALGMLPPAGAD